MARTPFDNIEVMSINQDESNIMISIPKYEELLITKGKYEELKRSQTALIDSLIDEYSKGKITINQIRVILGLKSIKQEVKYYPKNLKSIVKQKSNI